MPAYDHQHNEPGMYPSNDCATRSTPNRCHWIIGVIEGREECRCPRSVWALLNCAEGKHAVRWNIHFIVLILLKFIDLILLKNRPTCLLSIAVIEWQCKEAKHNMLLTAELVANSRVQIRSAMKYVTDKYKIIYKIGASSSTVVLYQAYYRS